MRAISSLPYLRAGLLASGLTFVAAPLLRAATITVTDPGDALHSPGCATTGTGTCTLRDAITFANANSGADEILVPLATVPLIRPTSALPPLAGQVFLNANFPNTSNQGPILDGGLAGAADGLRLNSNDNTVSGLTIREFAGSGIVVDGSNNRIGGPCAGSPCGIIDAVDSVGNGLHGIEVRSGANNWVQATTASLNGGNGVLVHGGATASRIGLPFNPFVRGTAVNNRLAGIRVGDGPADAATAGAALDVSLLYGNGGLDIDLGGDGPTANDSLDADTGPNGLVNFPTVTSAVVDAGGTTATVTGTYSGAPSATFSVRFHRADTGELVGEGTVTTDATGTGVLNTTLAGLVTPAAPGTSIPLVATATDAAGNTSELSGPIVTPLPEGLAFHTVTPCRILDTREATVAGGAALQHLRARLVRSGCGIPAEAKALSLNVTVTGATTDGHVLVAGSPWASGTSTLNFRAGQTRANSSVVTLDPRRNLAALAVLAPGGAVDLILDVNGYFR
jgi:hypothetical protein